MLGFESSTPLLVLAGCAVAILGLSAVLLATLELSRALAIVLLVLLVVVLGTAAYIRALEDPEWSSIGLGVAGLALAYVTIVAPDCPCKSPGWRACRGVLGGVFGALLVFAASSDLGALPIAAVTILAVRAVLSADLEQQKDALSSERKQETAPLMAAREVLDGFALAAALNALLALADSTRGDVDLGFATVFWGILGAGGLTVLLSMVAQDAVRKRTPEAAVTAEGAATL